MARDKATFTKLGTAAVMCAALMSSPLEAREGWPRFDPSEMVPLLHGPNRVDLDGDGHKDLVMKSRVTINSPHSFSLYTFHIWANAKSARKQTDSNLLEPQIEWYAVSFPDRSPPVGEFSVSSYQGADCMTNDYRLVIHHEGADRRHRQAYLVHARRDPGESFADPAPVTFGLYRLERGSEKAINEFSFIKIQEFKTAKSYCSVNNAFKEELGLPVGDPALDGYDYEPGQ